MAHPCCLISMKYGAQKKANRANKGKSGWSPWPNAGERTVARWKPVWGLPSPSAWAFVARLEINPTIWEACLKLPKGPRNQRLNLWGWLRNMSNMGGKPKGPKCRFALGPAERAPALRGTAPSAANCARASAPRLGIPTSTFGQSPSLLPPPPGKWWEGLVGQWDKGKHVPLMTSIIPPPPPRKSQTHASVSTWEAGGCLLPPGK